MDAFGLYLYGIVLQAAGDKTKAREVLMESIDQYPFNWSAWRALESLCADQTLV